MANARAKLFVLLLAGLATAAAVGVGCGSNSASDGSAFPGSTGGGAGASGGDAGDASLFGDGSDGSSTAVDDLTIDPASVTLDVTGATPKTQQFTAHGVVEGGAPFPVAATFTVDDPVPGTVSKSGLFTTTNAAGGVVHVTAAYGGKQATAVVNVVLHVDASSGSVPAGADELFDPTKNQVVQGDATHSPSLVYPVAETMFPQNLDRVLFQWRAAGGKLFKLTFDSPTLHFVVYSDGVQTECQQAGTGGACWESDHKTWTWLAASNAGQTTTLTLQSADPANPGTVYEAAPVSFHFAKKPVPGAIYYWSTTAAGTRRGALADPAPTNFLTPNETGGKCVACHTLSRNGKRLAADVGGENLWVVDVVQTAPPPTVFTNYNGKNIASSWATFNPDATRIVSAKGGVMTLRDGDTGAPIGPSNGAIALGTGQFGTQPDWAPDGKHLAFTLAKTNKDRGVSTASIAWLAAANDAFSTLEVIVPSTSATQNYGYPSFDPTSGWIAFGGGNKASDTDTTGQIFVAPAQPSAPIQQLVRADTLVNDTTVASGIANGMPTWAPTTDGGLRWIAFTSARDYGFVLAKGSKYGSQRKQLWVAAIDESKLGAGDPSYPAFRIPFQELSEDCHRPYWAQDAFVPTDGGTPEGGVDDDAGADGGACVDFGGDCTSGFCCVGLTCSPDGDGGYACANGVK